MNFPVQHDELTTLQYLITNYFPAKDAAQAQTVLSRLVTSAAIEAQGVPDGYAGAAASTNVMPTVAIHFSTTEQALSFIDKIRASWDRQQRSIASAPPAPQASVAQQEPAAWKHDCAALLTNDVELWIDACPHCGKPRIQPAQQGPVAWIRPSGKAMLEAGGYCTVYASDGMSNHSTPLYTHPAQQAKPQPLSDEQLKQLLAAEYNRGWDDCEATHDGP